MGSANADMLAKMTEEMNNQLQKVDNVQSNKNSLNSMKSSILVENIAKTQKFVENAEKQAGKGKFGRITNVLKSALKVIGTLGLSKKAKLEFSAAKFMLNNKNAEKIKNRKSMSSNLKESKKNVENVANKNTAIRKRNEKRSSMGR